MTVGFLILNYNSWELSSRLAQKVAQYRNLDRIVIVDNCSTDDSYKILQGIDCNKIDVVQSEKNGGYAYGNNYGANYCKGIGIDILFISNPDVDVEEEDIERIVDAFKDTGYSVLSGVEYDITKQMSHHPIWKQMTYKDDLMDCFFIGRKLCKTKIGVEIDKSMRIQEVELVKGSFLGVKLDKFLEVGGFDEGTFLFCEERILGKKMEMARAKIGVVTKARYFHNHSATINKAYKSVAKQIKLLYDSRLFYHKKYTKTNSLLIGILALAMRVSLLEYQIVDSIKRWRHL